MILPADIRKAKQRLQGQDPRTWVRQAANKTPGELADDFDLAYREDFLRRTMPSPAAASAALERIIAGNELQDVNYLARGARASTSIARVAIRDSSGRLTGWGTGFLIAPNVFITNNHVLGSAAVAERSEAEFRYERDVDGLALDAVPFALEPNRLFYTDAALDFSVVAVSSASENSPLPLSTFAYLPLVSALGKIVEGEWLTIIQHPNGERKQVCVRENRFIKKSDDVIWYTTDTTPGASGSPVFNNDWFVVALHHSGVPLEVDGHIQTVDGRAYDSTTDDDSKIQWIANEGIRVSRIVERLREVLPTHPLLASLFNATPAEARVQPGPVHVPQSVAPLTLPKEPVMKSEAASFPQYVSVELRVEADGRVTVASQNAQTSVESVLVEAAKPKSAPFDVPFDATYGDRDGYAAEFLGAGALRVNLPTLSPALEQAAAKLIKPQAGNTHVLKYHNFSVVLHARRRFAIYSAANVRYSQRYEMSRPPDVWRQDPRVPIEAQISDFYYRKNQFDRGHLTRREDLEFGPSAKKALQSAADTCHWSNCTPQHSRFNQNKQLWQGIERHLLEDSILQDQFDANIITGPILDEDDPVYDAFPDIQYPVRFWKVVAVPTGKKLFATAFILDQSEVIQQYGIDEAAPIGAYKTFQVKISEIERLTGLTFTSGPDAKLKSLSEVDPLAVGNESAPARRRSVGRHESASAAQAPSGYVSLESVADVVKPTR